MKKRKLIVLALMSCALFGVASCNGLNPPEEQQGEKEEEAKVAKSITLSSKEIALKPGEEAQLSVVVEPKELASSAAWVSADPSIATVSKTGLVRGVADGATTIMVSAGGKRAACTVTVSKYANEKDIPVEEVVLSNSSLVFAKGYEKKDDKGHSQLVISATVSPSIATNKKLIWTTSEDEKEEADKLFTLTEAYNDKGDVVTDRVALLIGNKAGEGTVTCKAESGGEAVTCKIEIKESDAENAIIKEPTTVNVWATFNDTYRTLIENAIAELKVEEPNLEVVYTKKSGSYSDIATMVLNDFSTGNYPDVVALYPDTVSEFIVADKGLDMEPYMNHKDFGWSEADFKDVYKSYLDEGSQYSAPGTYSLPAAKSTEAMYYDRRILGVNLSSFDPEVNKAEGGIITENYISNLTWEELFDHLAPALIKYNATLDDDSKLLNETVDPEHWAVLGYDSDDNLFITLAEQYGYGYTSFYNGKPSIDFNNNDMMKLLKDFHGYYKNHYLITKGTNQNSYVNTLSSKNQVLFSIGSTGGVSYQFDGNNPKDIGVALIPQAKGHEKKVISQGPSFAFLKHGDVSDESSEAYRQGLGAWLFYKKFSTAKFSTPWSMTTGYSPIRASIAESEAWQKYCDIESTQPATVSRLLARNAVYSSDVGDGGYLFSSPVFKGSAEARVQVGSLFTQVLSTANLTDEVLMNLFDTAEQNTLLKM